MNIWQSVLKKAKEFISDNYCPIEKAIESDYLMGYVHVVMSSLIGNSVIRFIDSYDAIYNAYRILGDEISKQLCYSYEFKVERAFK